MRVLSVNSRGKYLTYFIFFYSNWHRTLPLSDHNVFTTMGSFFKPVFTPSTPAKPQHEPTPAPEETPLAAPEPVAPAWSTPVVPAPSPYDRTPYPQSFQSTAKNVLNADVAVKGFLKFTDDLLVDGIVEGEITSQGILTIGQNAHVTAEINTSSVIIHGKLHGNIQVTDRVELKATAEVIGDIKAATIAIEAGAVFVGRSEVGASSAPVLAPSSKSSSKKKESVIEEVKPEDVLMETMNLPVE